MSKSKSIEEIVEESKKKKKLLDNTKSIHSSYSIKYQKGNFITIYLQQRM